MVNIKQNWPLWCIQKQVIGFGCFLIAEIRYTWTSVSTLFSIYTGNEFLPDCTMNIALILQSFGPIDNTISVYCIWGRYISRSSRP